MRKPANESRSSVLFALLLSSAIVPSQSPGQPAADPLLAEFAAKIAVGDLRGARALAEAASAAEPGSWRARVLQGYVLLALDQRVEAEARLQEALRNYDAGGKARAAEASGAPSVAGGVPTPAKPPAPPVDDGPSVESVAPEALQRKDPGQAAQRLKEEFEARPDRPDYAFEAARLWQVAHREWRAWLMYERLRAHADLRVRQRAADAQRGLGFGKSPQDAPTTSQNPKLDLGLLQLKNGQTEEATDNVDDAAANDPGNPIPAMIAGGLVEENRPPTESVRNWLRLLDRATGAARDKIAAHLKARGEELHRQGEELMNLGKALEALVLFKAAVETGPGHWRSHLQLAACYEQTGNHEDAARHRRIVAGSGDPSVAPEAQRMIAETKRAAERAPQMEGTDPRAAAAAYATGFAADPSLVRCGFRAAELFYGLGQTAKVVELCRQLVGSPEYGERARQMLAAIRQKAAERLAPKAKEAERLLAAKDIAAAMQLLGDVFEAIDDLRFRTARDYFASRDLPQAEMVLRSALAALLDSGSEVPAPIAGLEPIREGADFTQSSGRKMSWVDWGATTGAGSVEGDPARRAGFWVSAESVSAPQVGRLLRNDRNAPTSDDEGVSWFQADAFCASLTGAEREAGRLPEGYAYQLPDLAMCKRAHATREIPDNINIWLGGGRGFYYSSRDGARSSLEAGSYHYHLQVWPVLVRAVTGGRP